MFTLEQKELIKAAEKGNLIELERLINLISDSKEKEEFIHISNDFALQGAARNGHLAMVRKLLEFTSDPKKRENMIRANNYQAFIDAIGFGHLEVAEELLKYIIDPKERQSMMSANQYMAFKIVVGRKDLSTFEYLLSVFPDNLFKAISDNIVRYIENILPIEQHRDFINKVINKFDKDFIQFISLRRDSKLETSYSKIFDAIKFTSNIVGAMQVGINKLQESLFDHLQLPQFIFHKILFYCEGRSSTLNDIDREKVYLVMKDINKEIVNSHTIKNSSKSPKVNFVEKYIEQTEKAESIGFNL